MEVIHVTHKTYHFVEINGIYMKVVFANHLLFVGRIKLSLEEFRMFLRKYNLQTFWRYPSLSYPTCTPFPS